uniref:Uncharacterized protein n=1 Tax=Glossina pallidipes TaxID=7398 RepID=A0A1B0AHE7_GLOPL
MFCILLRARQREKRGSLPPQVSFRNAPNDTIYMVCGVVIAMLLVGLIIILVAVTINYNDYNETNVEQQRLCGIFPRRIESNRLEQQQPGKGELIKTRSAKVLLSVENTATFCFRLPPSIRSYVAFLVVANN